jgi:hypothetical protein
LWERERQLVGVAVLAVPMNSAVLTDMFPGLAAMTESAELARLVLLDEAAANGVVLFGPGVRPGGRGRLAGGGQLL